MFWHCLDHPVNRNVGHSVGRYLQVPLGVIGVVGLHSLATEKSPAGNVLSLWLGVSFSISGASGFVSALRKVCGLGMISHLPFPAGR